MSVVSRWRRWFGGNSKSRKAGRISQRRPRVRSRLALQPLEDRRLLSLVAVGPEFRVNTATVGQQLQPDLAMDADGDFVITWMGFQPGSAGGADIYAQRYNAAGLRQGNEFRVNTFTASTQYAPKVAVDGDGDGRKRRRLAQGARRPGPQLIVCVRWHEERMGTS